MLLIGNQDIAMRAGSILKSSPVFRRAGRVVGLCLIVASTGSWAQAVGEERLLISTPKGWVVTEQQQKGAQLTTELVPDNQSPPEWRDKLSIQVFAQKPVKTPQAFQQALTSHWRESCSTPESAPIRSGQENGYAFDVWMLACRQRPDGDGPVFAWFKAIQGRDAFYLIQRSFAYAPDETTLARWMRYLRSVQLCDSRLPDRACPLPGE